MSTELGISSIFGQKAVGRGSSAAGTFSRHSTRQSSITAVLMMTWDVVAVFIAAYLSLHLNFRNLPGDWSQVEPNWIGAPNIMAQIAYLSWFIACLLVLNWHDGLYGRLQIQSILHEQRMTVQSCLVAGLLLCGGMYMTHNGTISRVAVTSLVSFTTMLLCALRGWWRYSASRKHRMGIDTKNVLIIGVTHVGDALRKQIVRHERLGRKFKGFVEMPECGAPHASAEVLGNFYQLRHLVRQHFIDEVIVTENCSAASVVDLVAMAQDLDFEVIAMPGLYEEMSPSAPIFYLGDFPVVAIHRRNDKAMAGLIKRCVDTAFTMALLLFLAPVFFAIALAVKLTSSGPVFYVSDRIGKKGRVFRLWKFRTMCADAERQKASLMATNERDGILFKMTNDPRITPVGRFLRKYSLDELPQLFNVILGDMSLVGPRPPLASEVAKYELEHYRRLDVLPGLTGLWQVRARGNPSFEQYVALDIAYVESWNLWMDLKIMVRTAEVVLRGTGV